MREEEKRRTAELERLVEEASRERNVDKISKDELKEGLVSRGLSAEDVRRAIYEAERDCILSSYPFTKKRWVYELIPLEREKGLE